MPIPFVCPGCRKKANAPDEAAGKAVRCPHCQQSIRIPVEEQRPRAVPPPLPKTAPPSKSEGIMPANLASRALQREARPNKRPVPVKPPHRREEIESDDDRPRRRRPPTKSTSSKAWILVGAGFAAAVVMLGIGLVLFIAFRSQPREAIVAQQIPVAPVAAVPVPVAPIPVGAVQAVPVPPAVEPMPVPNNWTIAFRSNDASIWGKDIDNGPDHRAISFKQIPSDIRYLRMQECTNNAFIIIAMSKDRLGKDSVNDGIGWNGTGRLEWKGRHLGVYNRAWDQLQRGDISFSTPAFFKGYKGWGFGHRIRDDDVQGYAWNGAALPRTVFEISVTTGELSTAEKEHLLGPTGKAPLDVAANDGAKGAGPGIPKEDTQNNGGIVAKADIKPAPAPTDLKPSTVKSQVFVFDGKSRIVTPLERFAPVTLEAWFRPSRDPVPRRHGDRTQYLIGSDIPNQYGYGLGIRYDGNTLGGLQMETMRTFYNSNTPFSASEWSHAAAVFAPTEVAIYLNGKPAFKQIHNLEIRGGTTFAIGKSGRDATVPFFFTGDIREIRISSGMRYNQEFTPPTVFQKDAASALIYRASDTNGKTVIDLSGNGRDGQLDGVLVAGDDEKVAGNPAVLAGEAKEYEPKSQRFTIAMPKGVKSHQASKVLAISIPPGVKLPSKGLPPRPTITAEVSLSQLADGTTFTAASIGMPAVLLREIPEDRRLELYRDIFLKAMNGRIVSEIEISQGRYSGRDYLIDLPVGQMRMQLLMLGGAGCYAMVETGSIERLATRDVDEYFDSFKIKE